MKLINISPEYDNKYKLRVILLDKDHYKTVTFGAYGYDDFTKHHDKNKKRNYIARHKGNEDWTKSGLLTKGFWSRWILWNKPTIEESVYDVIKRFSL
jgi:hypothetical protein